MQVEWTPADLQYWNNAREILFRSRGMMGLVGLSDAECSDIIRRDYNDAQQGTVMQMDSNMMQRLEFYISSWADLHRWTEEADMLQPDDVLEWLRATPLIRVDNVQRYQNNRGMRDALTAISFDARRTPYCLEM